MYALTQVLLVACIPLTLHHYWLAHSHKCRACYSLPGFGFALKRAQMDKHPHRGHRHLFVVCMTLALHHAQVNAWPHMLECCHRLLQQLRPMNKH